MRAFALGLPLLVLALLMSVPACEQAPGAGDEFAAGAFPPTLSDKEYHQRHWTRNDCLTCHETGVKGAPKMKHTSLPPLAKEVKCRSCHVPAGGNR